MMKVLLLAMLLFTIFLVSCSPEAPAVPATDEAPESSPTTAEDSGGIMKEPLAGTNTHTIQITPDGFNPTELRIKVGDTVTFVNQDTQKHRPASDVHPTHTIYPGTDVSKCSSPDAGLIFDACRGLQTGETWSFTFTEVGSWSFHDHLRPSFTGTIVVE